MDFGHKLTDKQLAELEQRIASIYDEAAKELTGTVNAYFDAFKGRDEAMKKRLDNGEITKEYYQQWRLNQIGRGKRYEAMRDKVAERYTAANEVAVAYANDLTPGIYSLNWNYAAYTIEQAGADVDFTLFDESTVRRLAVENPGLMPNYPAERAVKRGIDLDYGKQQITASVTSGILQGKSIGRIADDMQTRMKTMNRTSALRTARTAITGAQNAGRMDSYKAAQDMGIKLEREWVATLDGRTRHEHAMLDGQTAAIDKPFKVDGVEIMYPGDPSAPGYLIYNCRCTLIASLPELKNAKAERWSRDPVTGEKEKVENLTYTQWEQQKREKDPQAWDNSIKKIRNQAADEKQHSEYRELLGKEVPKTLAGFQSLKYDNSEEWAKTKAKAQNRRNQIKLKEKIDSGELSTKISVQKQNRHVEGTMEFERYLKQRESRGQTPQSVLDISFEEAQSIVDTKKCTGYVEFSDGVAREYLNADGVVGRYYGAGEYHDTSRIFIQYSKRGTHIIPIKEKPK